MNLNSAIETILSKRGISAADDVAEFLSDKPSLTYDPFLLKDMYEGVDLIMMAVETGQKICIYGDYDADGVTSVSLMMDVLRRMGADVSYYIPSRFDEGYGLNSDAIDKIKAAGADIIITVDCGSTSVDEVMHAQEIGLEVLVTDHHTIRDEVPDCLIINPNQSDCHYPFKYLAGVGVAFKLAQALCETANLPKEVLTRNLDLVAIGTVGDVVPLIDENRTLVKFGLRALNLSKRVGLKELMTEIGLKQGEIISQNISFVIAPHINAAGRMGSASLASRLMLCDDEQRAKELAGLIRKANNTRRSVQENLFKSCVADISKEDAGKGYLLVELKDAHEGVTGIVAGKLKEKYNVPSLIVTQIGDGYSKGTGRSVDGISLFELLNRKPELFVKFGGHAAACGFTISDENIPLLRASIEEGLTEQKNKDVAEAGDTPAYDVQLQSVDLNEDFFAQQRMLEPFGRCNEVPLIRIDANIDYVSRMQKRPEFLQFTANFDGKSIRGVDFVNADIYETLLDEAMRSKRSIALIGNLELSNWNGKQYMNLVLKSAKMEN